MLKLLKTIITISLILINLTPTFCQTLNSLPYNHAVVKAISDGDKNYQKNKADIHILFDSVFFDDFSDYHYSVFPNEKHWSDNDAYINSTYPDSMISMGVATLDAFDRFGYPYYSVESPAVASDTLTSQPFEFTHTPEKNVYFSFFYQPGGKGDLPEGLVNEGEGLTALDTLILEFYSVDEEKWERAFHTIDNSDTFHFTQVIVEVDPTYLKDGFRFRFRNYTSMPSDYQQGEDMGKYSNADQWHIDYIQMKETDDTSDLSNIKDITIMEPMLPSLTEYISVPWRHLELALTAAESMTIPLTLRNFDPNFGESFNVDRVFITNDLVDDQNMLNRTFHNIIEPNTIVKFQDELRANITYEELDPGDTIGRFERICYIKPDIDVSQPTVNDTIKRTEIYYDQYIYDDGSAEFGFGIGGESADNMRVAQRFRTFRKNTNPDTLKAILIYFGKSVDSTTIDYSYSVSIRKNDSIYPGRTNLYTSDTLYPDYSLALNEFTRIEIEPVLLISDTFFVVINQIDGFLNIGYDINNNNLDKIWVYSNQTWTNPYSIRPGSLMIRPSFGRYSLPTAVDEHIIQSGQLEVFPNPVSERLYLNLGESEDLVHDIQIINLVGVTLMHYKTDDVSIPVSSLNPGMYFIVVTSSDKKYIRTAKFIKE